MQIQIKCILSVCEEPIPSHFRVPKEVKPVDDKLQEQFEDIERGQQQLCNWDFLGVWGDWLMKILHFIVSGVQNEDGICKNDSLKAGPNTQGYNREW